MAELTRAMRWQPRAAQERTPSLGSHDRTVEMINDAKASERGAD